VARLVATALGARRNHHVAAKRDAVVAANPTVAVYTIRTASRGAKKRILLSALLK